MKHFLLAVLIISCLTATCCPAFAAVECTVPKNLSGAAEAPDVPILERVPDKTIPADTAEQEMAKGRPAIWLLLAVVILVSFIPAKKKLFSRWFTGNMKNDGDNKQKYQKLLLAIVALLAAVILLCADVIPRKNGSLLHIYDIDDETLVSCILYEGQTVYRSESPETLQAVQQLLLELEWKPCKEVVQTTPFDLFLKNEKFQSVHFYRLSGQHYCSCSCRWLTSLEERSWHLLCKRAL